MYPFAKRPQFRRNINGVFERCEKPHSRIYFLCKENGTREIFDK